MREDSKSSVLADNGRGGPGWRYQCKKCGYKVGLETAFPETCPGCGAGGWWGHLVTTGTATPDPINSHNGIMQTNNLSGNQPAMSEVGGIKDGKKGNGHRGRPKTTMPEVLIKGLVSQGYGCVVIAQKLTEQGTPVHYSTIWRYLQRSKIPGANQN